ncbi:hypothetical protein QY97_03617 [Bacillus thermotolerans]|nr:hypothetical protein QY97_03617 [Bacillus thermotolerans]KKB41902.1 hypothetical protein QY96_01804 [Bacillus thermotolerans]
MKRNQADSLLSFIFSLIYCMHEETEMFKGSNYLSVFDL